MLFIRGIIRGGGRHGDVPKTRKKKNFEAWIKISVKRSQSGSSE